MRPVVFFVINSLAGGGAERIMARLLTHSSDRTVDYDLHLILLDEEDQAYSVPNFVTVHRLDTHRSMLAGLRGLRNLVRQHRPKMMLSFLSRSNFLAVVAARLCGVPVVISERINTSSHHPAGLKGFLPRFLTRVLYPMADKIIVVSEGLKNDLVSNYGVAPARVSVIPNPIDFELLRRQAKEGKPQAYNRYLVAMGRFVPTKNFPLLIEAYEASGLTWDLVILGDGPERGALEALVRQRGLERRVNLPGFLENPFAIIQGAACYILSSNGEGFPNGLVEAMALGVPVIATNCQSGPSEILDDAAELDVTGPYRAKYGMIVPTNDLAAMTSALADLSSSDLNEFGKDALRGADRYSLERSVDQYWKVLESSARQVAIR